ncbi:MAG: S46 family peptidase [Bacteroidales bacterium]|nr:S46 family peptidase [Bacteroidales bacterium]
MKKVKSKLLLIVLSLCISFYASADEGMWLLSLLNEINYNTIQDKGMQLSLEELYSIDKLSLKDAIVAIDGGSCTGSLVSENGLMITNHHCGYSEIQEHSSLENDYLKDGFWAHSLKEELPNPGKSVSFLIDVKDITDRVNEMKAEQIKKGAERPNMMRIRRLISRETVKGTHYNAEVHAMFGGNSYYLFTYETYSDVRLVGAPPSAIGNFGGETDNWMWPRHTADFTFFRIYTGPDGKPAKYSPENIPLKPKKYLKMNATGVNEKDFAFIMGYPGKTDRYNTSYGIEEILNISNPISIVMRGKKLEIIRKAMNESDEVRIKYASKFAGLSNYWKYGIGQSECLKKYNTIEDKQTLENQFASWVKSNNELNNEYGNVLSSISEAYKNKANLTSAIKYYNEAILMGPEIINFSNRLNRLKKSIESKKYDEQKLQKSVESLLKRYQSAYKDYDVKVDKQIFEVLLQDFVENIDKQYLNKDFIAVAEKYNWDMTALANDIYSNSIFTDYQKVKNYLESLNINSVISDPAMEVAVPLMTGVFSLNTEKGNYRRIIASSNKLFIKGLMEMNPEKDFYPNANSTMRLTYGKVSGYEASDAVTFNYYTTIDGVMEKYNSKLPEYEIPEKLKSLYESKDFGTYQTDGTIRTCFLTDLDITGGNSGSPVLNSKGELVGLAFDGNWEAMSSDIDFIPEKQKCINADIRYVLFIIDKFADCQYIMNELNIITKD